MDVGLRRYCLDIHDESEPLDVYCTTCQTVTCMLCHQILVNHLVVTFGSAQCPPIGL